MKQRNLGILIILVIMAFAGAALATGNLPYTVNKTQVQNLRGIQDSSSRCDTATRTKGTFKSYTTAGYSGFEAQAVDSAGAPVIGIWKQDGKKVWIGSTFSGANSFGRDYAATAFEGYSSGTARAVTTCIRRQ